MRRRCALRPFFHRSLLFFSFRTSHRDCFDSFFDKTFRSSLGKCIPHAPHGTKAEKPADGRSCPQARPAPPAKALALVRSTYSSVLLVDTLCRLLKLARAAPASAVDRTPPFRNLSLDIAFVDEFPFVPRQQVCLSFLPLGLVTLASHPLRVFLWLRQPMKSSP